MPKPVGRPPREGSPAARARALEATVLVLEKRLADAADLFHEIDAIVRGVRDQGRHDCDAVKAINEIVALAKRRREQRQGR